MKARGVAVQLGPVSPRLHGDGDDVGGDGDDVGGGGRSIGRNETKALVVF